MTNFGDTMIYGLIVTLLGVGIVFLVLVLLQYILKLMEIVFYKEKKAGLEAAKAPEAKPVEADIPQVDAADSEDDDQLVSVITAALMSCMGRDSNIVIRSIRRVDDLTPAWGKISRAEQMANRF